MTILPTVLSALMSILLWLYVRHNVKRNFIHLFELHPKWLWGFDLLFFYAGFFRFIYRLQNSYINNFTFYFLMNLSYVLLGLLGLVLGFFVIIDLKNLYRRFVPRPAPVAANSSRRDFFKKGLTLTGVAASSVVTGAGYANSFDPKIVKVNIPLQVEHKNLSGLKIVQISDVHIGPTLKLDFCEMLAFKVNALNPDVVVITGDLIDGKVSFLKDDLAPLLNMKSRLGTFYVTGNHEYYWYAGEWIEWARVSGLNPLINENIKLNFNNTDFYLAGVSDPSSIKLDKKNATDPHKAAQGIPADAYKILLAHQPKTCFEACKAGFHTQLSGHTHGGQGFPWSMIVMLIQPYVKGLHLHEGMNIYVHSGTGFWGPPNRFMVNSEIAEIVFT